MSTVVLVAALVAAGLLAGLFYAYACSVMPGLARGDDKTFVEAMRGINVAIVNPVFMLSFLGAPVISVVAAVVTDGDARWWAVASAVLAVATVAVTFAGNIPLNNAIDRVGAPDEIADLGAVRRAFEPGWVRLNVVRAVTSTLATAGFAWAALVA